MQKGFVLMYTLVWLKKWSTQNSVSFIYQYRGIAFLIPKTSKQIYTPPHCSAYVSNITWLHISEE